MREFARYVSLNVLGMLAISCYILVDTFFVARGMGSRGLAALNLAIPVYSLIHGTGLLLGVGGGTRFSILHSLPRRQEAVYPHTLLLGAVLAAGYVLLGALSSDALTTLLGADSEVFDMTHVYLRVLLLFAPAFLLNDVLLCFVRNDGAPQRAMTGMVAGSVSNIALDYVTIFLLDMGMLGAVLSTGLAAVISILVQLPHLLRPDRGFRLQRCTIRLGLWGEILSSGLYSLVTEVSSGVVMVVFNVLILGLMGNLGVAAYGVVANISLVVIAIYTGLAQGIQPLVSRSCGLQRPEEGRRTLRRAVCTSLAVSAVLYGVLFLGAEAIVGLFNGEGSALLQKTAVSGLRIYFTACPFVGMNIVLAGYFSASDRAAPAGVLSLLRGFAVILPMAVVLARIGGMAGLWAAFPATEALVCLTGWLLARKKPAPNGKNVI